MTALLLGAVLIYGTLDMPKWGDPHSPANTHVSPYYLRHSLEDTATPNVVTSVLADYRGYDTLGETTVIFTAGMACMLLLRRTRKR
jgi:multicomponent Na+:H+ antiporter subunit B